MGLHEKLRDHARQEVEIEVPPRLIGGIEAAKLVFKMMSPRELIDFEEATAKDEDREANVKKLQRQLHRIETPDESYVIQDDDIYEMGQQLYVFALGVCVMATKEAEIHAGEAWRRRPNP